MEERSVAQGVVDIVPVWLQNLLWYMYAVMEVEQRDCVQTFRLSRVSGMQMIEHAQKNPPYTYVLRVPAADAVTEKIYIIEDFDHVTMLLAEEY